MLEKRILPILMLLTLCCVAKPVPAEQSSSSDIINGKDFLIVTVQKKESLASLAERYLGSIDKAWQIAEYNGITKTREAQQVVIPLKPVTPGGILQNGYQTVPVLYYPTITAEQTRPEAVSADLFTKQLAYLNDNGFTTVSLDRLYAFFHLNEQLPPRAVVITFDTTKRWAYDIAYPILLHQRMKAALFIRPDLIGRPGHMTWEEVKKLAAAGFDIGANGSSGKKGTRSRNGNNGEALVSAWKVEIGTPREVIRQQTGHACHYFAYPYGTGDDMVVALLKQYGYRAAFTRDPGSNPFFVDDYKIKRSLVKNDVNLNTFRELLETFNAADLQ